VGAGDDLLVGSDQLVGRGHGAAPDVIDSFEEDHGANTRLRKHVAV